MVSPKPDVKDSFTFEKIIGPREKNDFFAWALPGHKCAEIIKQRECQAHTYNLSMVEGGAGGGGITGREITAS